MKTNYVLIDYENVQPETVAVINKENYKAIVFVGANQAKVTFQVASALQRMGDRAEYIKISSSGSNALDFHIAFYIGRISANEPEAHFYIISKDTGFDPLIEHLKNRNTIVYRKKDVSELPIVKIPDMKISEDKITKLMENLKHMGASRPRTAKTLQSTIKAFYQKKLSESECTELVNELQNKKIIIITDKKVSYNLTDK
jgi:hypothetical protein